MENPEAVTIADAAASLGVTTQRIHQLLNEGALAGPPQPEDQKRAPSGVPRVWVNSLLAQKERRTQREQPAASKRRRRKPSVQVESASILELKVSLDLVREDLARERQQSRNLTQLLAQAVAALDEQQRLSERGDRIADGYSRALGELLAPTDIADL